MRPHPSKKNIPKQRIHQEININELKTLLTQSYHQKKNEFELFCQRTQHHFLENIQPSSIEQEEEHYHIFLQNMLHMVNEGNKIYSQKKETTPFRTLILRFPSEKGFHKITRVHPICSDSISRISIRDYLFYLMEYNEERKTRFENLLQHHSPLFSVHYEFIPNHHMIDHLQQIESEFPEYKDSMSFYLQKEFVPIEYFKFYATLKIDI
jgi:hypothetical protein